MQNYDYISIRSAASFRAEVRNALRGKWKAALLITLTIMLMTGLILGAECLYETSTDLAPYWQLTASIGPFTSVSHWKDGALYSDAYHSAASYYPILLPYSPLFVAAAALTGLMFLILTPIASVAQLRLHIDVLDGKAPDFSVFHTSGRQYWLYVRTLLLSLWHACWPMLLMIAAGAALSFLVHETRILLVLFVLAGVILMFIRCLRYGAAVYLTVVHPEITAREAVQTSAHVMKGRKRRFVCLYLSFIGWLLLYGIVNVVLEAAFGTTPVMPLAALLGSLAYAPLLLYMTAASTAFLRDAERHALNSGGVPEQMETVEPSVSDDPPSDTDGGMQ